MSHEPTDAPGTAGPDLTRPVPRPAVATPTPTPTPMPRPAVGPAVEPGHGPATTFSDQEPGAAVADEVLASLDGLEERPVAEHVAVFEAAHEKLRAALSGAGDRPAG